MDSTACNDGAILRRCNDAAGFVPERIICCRGPVGWSFLTRSNRRKTSDLADEATSLQTNCRRLQRNKTLFFRDVCRRIGVELL